MYFLSLFHFQSSYYVEQKKQTGVISFTREEAFLVSKKLDLFKIVAFTGPFLDFLSLFIIKLNNIFNLSSTTISSHLKKGIQPMPTLITE